MKSLVIAVDGYAATGKSTTAESVADKLGYIFINSGAMYRAVTLHMLRNNIPIESESSEFQQALKDVDVEFRREGDDLVLFLNGQKEDDSLRSMEVSGRVSEVAAIPAVRRKLVDIQRKMGANGGVVMDGRDIGTVVFPNADLKVFLTAGLEVRVSRRMAQIEKKGGKADRDEVRRNLLHRDHIDSTREDSPLKKADDAIEIDTSQLTIPVQVDQVVAMARELEGKVKA